MENLSFPLVTDSVRKLPFYLTRVNRMYSERHIVRTAGFRDFEWIQCRSGEGELILEGETYRIKPHQGIFIFPEVAHEYYPIKTPWLVDFITFNGYHVKSFLKNVGIERSCVLYTSNSEIILNKIQKAYNLKNSMSILKGYNCSVIVYDILVDLLKFASKNNFTSVQEQYLRLQPVFEYIENNYNKSVTLEDLAILIDVTPQRFCAIFKETLKMRPFEYLNNVRINKSKELLINELTIRIQDIASFVGFESTTYFCTVFKKFEGISPTNFRKLHGIYRF